VAYLETAVRDILGAPDVDREALFGALGRREPVAAEDDQSHPAGLTPFLVGERYGTRASTLVMMDADGACHFEERRFDAAGALAGETRERFDLAG
jgi:hypothetical protein